MLFRSVWSVSDAVLASESVLVLQPRTDPNGDIDGDGMTDPYELANGLDPRVNDASGDLDGDGVSNLAEFHLD